MDTLVKDEADLASQDSVQDEHTQSKDDGVMSKVLNASATPPSIDDVTTRS